MKTALVALLLALPGTLFAQSLPPVTVGADDRIPIDGKQVYVLSDSEHRLNWSTIQRKAVQDRFRPSPVSNLNFGFSTDDYWARLEVRTDDPTVPHILEVGFTNYTKIELYTVDSSGGVRVSRVGDGVGGRSVREYPFYTFGIRLAPLRNQTIYLHLASHYGQQYFPLTIWTESAYIEHNVITTLLWGGFYGILFIVLLYHAFVFFFTRERSYLLLCVYLFWFIFYESCRGYNLLPRFVYPDLWDLWGTRGLVTIFPIGLIMFMLFYNYSLRLTQHFRWFRWVIVGLSGWCLYCVALLYATPLGQLSTNQLAAWEGVPVGLTMIIVSTALWLKGEKTARFYALASIATAGGAILMMMQRAGVIGSESLFIKFGFNIGSLLEFILLTLGLADRFREERRKQRAAELARVRQEARREAEHQLAFEQERERMSLELHNDIGNSLMSARLMLNRLDAPSLTPTEKIVYEQLAATMADTYDRLKDIAHGLNARKLAQTGLVAELNKLVRLLNNTGLVQFGLSVGQEANELPTPLQAMLYSSAAELTQNVLRHARAENGHIRLTIDESSVRLSVRDDGVGPFWRSGRQGQGIRSIQKQVDETGGTFTLKPLPEGGTSAVIVVPLSRSGTD